MNKQTSQVHGLPRFLFQPEDTSGCLHCAQLPHTGNAELTGKDSWREALKSATWIGLSICLAMMLAQLN